MGQGTACIVYRRVLPGFFCHRTAGALCLCSPTLSDLPPHIASEVGVAVTRRCSSKFPRSACLPLDKTAPNAMQNRRPSIFTDFLMACREWRSR